MRFSSLMLSALASLTAISYAEQSNYLRQLSTLSQGAVNTIRNSSGIVWLNVTKIAPEKLPHIQQDLGLHTYDNLHGLKATVSLAATAASDLKYGDLVYLFTAFAMNGYGPYTHLSSNEMQRGLLAAVTPENSTIPDEKLIELYAGTSSIPSLREAFLALKSLTLNPSGPTAPPTSPEAAAKQEWGKTMCDVVHRAFASVCQELVSSVSINVTWMSGGPRSICREGCCISWSANATFQIRNLASAADYCVKFCPTGSISCEVWGVDLQGTLVSQCMSNRANKCKA